ncbi:MAG: hypothetical protein VYC39_20470 [Myxococcota bacterium]|nr:hypothetical protein [Myxococcota bacterium]
MKLPYVRPDRRILAFVFLTFVMDVEHFSFNNISFDISVLLIPNGSSEKLEHLFDSEEDHVESRLDRNDSG